MPCYKKNNKRVVFIRVPRTGSSSIHKSFLKADWEYDKVFPISCSYNHKSFDTHISYLKKANIDINNITLAFTVLRDPIDKIQAYYKSIVRIPGYTNPKDWENWINGYIRGHKKIRTKAEHDKILKKTSSRHQGFPLLKLFPNYPDLTPISINEWWDTYKDIIIHDRQVGIKSMTDIVIEMLDYPKIKKEFFFYTYESFANIIDNLNLKLNTNLQINKTNCYKKLDKSGNKIIAIFNNDIQKEIRELYSKDYKLINKVI